jgi:hypothetical protein
VLGGRGETGGRLGHVRGHERDGRAVVDEERTPARVFSQSRVANHLKGTPSCRGSRSGCGSVRNLGRGPWLAAAQLNTVWLARAAGIAALVAARSRVGRGGSARIGRAADERSALAARHFAADAAFVGAA